MNNDLISREALKEAIRKRLGISSLNYLTEQERVVVEEIDNATTVERPQDNLISSLTELCNRYCKNCPVANESNDCADCMCTHIRGIIWREAENDKDIN